MENVPIAGNWSGTWTNSKGNSGTDSIPISEDAQGNVQGAWASNGFVIAGKRLDATHFEFEGRAVKCYQHFDCTIDGNTLIMDFITVNLNAPGYLTGQFKLTLSP